MIKKNEKKEYPVLPLRNTVLFPQQIFPVYIGREQSLNLIDSLPKQGKKYIVVIAQKDGSVENPSKTDLYEWGTLAIVMNIGNIYLEYLYLSNINNNLNIILKLIYYIKEIKDLFFKSFKPLTLITWLKILYTINSFI